MTASSKSLQDQVREIQKLIEDANETLGQARWALETLVFRLVRRSRRRTPASTDGERPAGGAEQRAAEQEDAEHRGVVGIAVVEAAGERAEHAPSPAPTSGR